MKKIIDKNKNILDLYPIGSIYISVVDINPSEYFGGVWEEINNVFLLAQGNIKAGELGGEENHILTIDELPNHNHKTVGHLFSTFPVWVTNSQKSYLKDPTLKPQFIVESVDNEINGPYFLDRFNDTIDGVSKWDTGFIGGNQEHNNMPPYLSVYMWKRVE